MAMVVLAHLRSWEGHTPSMRAELLRCEYPCHDGGQELNQVALLDHARVSIYEMTGFYVPEQP
jgi:hypothetical protein